MSDDTDIKTDEIPAELLPRQQMMDEILADRQADVDKECVPVVDNGEPPKGLESKADDNQPFQPAEPDIYADQIRQLQEQLQLQAQINAQLQAQIQAKPLPEPVPEVTELDRAKAIGEAIREYVYGEEDDALSMLAKALSQEKTPSVDVNAIAQQVRENLLIDQSMNVYRNEFAEIANDPVLEQLAVNHFHELVATGMQAHQAIIESAKDVQAWKSKFAPKVDDAKPSATRNNRIIEHKASRDVPTGVSNRAPTNREPVQSAFDIVEEMIAQRQLPSLTPLQRQQVN